MLDHVLQAFLRDAVQRELDMVGQPGVVEVDLHFDLRDRTGQARQPARQPQVVEHGWSQPADRRAGLLQRQVDQLARLAQLFGHHLRIVDGPGCRVEPVRQRDEPL
jgi:hypothetical protein